MSEQYTKARSIAQAQPYANEWLDALTEVCTTGLSGHRAQALLDDAKQGLIPADKLPKLAVEALTESGLAEASVQTLEAIFEPGDKVELRALNAQNGQVAICLGTWGDPGDHQALIEFVRQHNGVDNLYFGANPRKPSTTKAAEAADIAGRRIVVLDLDNKDAPASDPDWSTTVRELMTLNPYMVLESGNGHRVWLPVALDQGIDPDATTVTLADAMASLGADNMADLPRIARLPYTLNIPSTTKRVRGAKVRLAKPVAAAKSEAPTNPPTIPDLVSNLKSIATILNLPGNGQQKAANNNTATSNAKKSPTPAPSPELLIAAVKALPNDQAYFDSRGSFVKLCLAIKGAAMAGRCETQGREAWLEFAGRWNGPVDPVHDADLWDGCRVRHIGWGSLMKILEQVNPTGRAALKSAEARHAFREDATATKSKLGNFTLMPVAAVSPVQIPPRRWLYGRVVLSKFISLLVAPGGAGKSALIMVEAVAMATGKELLAGERPIRPLKVWLHNAEDGPDEQQLRLAGILKDYQLTHPDLGQRLFMTSGRDSRIQLARVGRDGPQIVPGIVDIIVENVLDAKVDVIILDPLGATHGLPENANEAINLLAGALREIAERTGAAVILLHHTSKVAAADMDSAGAGASRGASALVDAVRVVRQMIPMTSTEAVKFGIADKDRRSYLRIANGKANLAPAQDANWIKMTSVKVGNVTPEYPDGDEVGVPRRWIPPAQVSGTNVELSKVQDAITAYKSSGHLPRLSDRSPDWVGAIIAKALGLDTGGPSVKAADRTVEQASNLSRVRGLLAGWLDDGSLVRRKDQDQHRRPTECVDVGTAPSPFDDTNQTTESPDV